MSDGSKVWIVPDGWLPPQGGVGNAESHESLMILNTGTQDANVLIDIYFDDRDPVIGLEHTIGAERIRAIRMDDADDLGHLLPRETQYALRIRSDCNVTVQFGRLDVRQPNLAYYGAMAHPAG